MKKLLVLTSALFLMCTVGFAQTEKTVKSDDTKVKIEKAEKALEKNAKTESTDQTVKMAPTDKKAVDKAKAVATEKMDAEKTVKTISTEKDAKTQATEKKATEKAVKALSTEKDKKAPSTEKKNSNFGVAGKTTNAEKTEKAEKQDGPEISFKETNHNFGNIPFKGNGSYEFVFVNTGTEPLILTQPKSSCGCTVPEWPKQPILPGEQNVIKVTYKNTDRPGNFNKYVTVFSNAVVNKEVKLYIKGTVEPQPTDATPLKMESVGTPVNKN